MGYLKSVGTSIIYIGAFLAAITFIPGLPPNAEFKEYSIVAPKALTNELSFNKRLDKAEFLFEGQVKGAESFASYNGELYTGVHGGYIVKITKDKLVPIVKFGKECDGIWQESKCGRPLGLKFDNKGNLYVVDAYYGIFRVDIKTGKYEKIVDNEKPIEGKIPKIMNSVDIASNGDLYWSDSSTEFDLQDGSYAVLTNPSGRLIRYNAATKKNEVLISNLGFPNGVALSRDEQFVIVLETMTSRIIKYNIKGPKKGQHEIFIEGLPGLPDNVHSDNKNGFLVSIVAYADSEHPLISQSLMPHPYIRRMIVRLLTIIELPFKYLQTYYPNFYSEKIIRHLGGFESTLFLYPKITTILHIDNQGKILDAAYSTDEKIFGISSAYIHKEYLWLGSFFEEYIARVPLKQAFPSLVDQEKVINIDASAKPEKRNVQNAPKQEKVHSTTETPKLKESKPIKSDSKKTSKEKSSPSQKSTVSN